MRHVRVRVEMVLEIDDSDELIRAAWARISGDEQMPIEEREQAARDVSKDSAEAVAYLVDPVDLVDEMPGVVLAQASWSSELTRHDPDQTWLDADDADDEDEGEEEDEEEEKDERQDERHGEAGAGGADGEGRG